MPTINPKYVAIANIHKPLADLQALNAVYLKGQTIYAIDAYGNVGQKVGDWDFEHQPQSAGTAFNDLPWIVSPMEAGADRLNPFPIYNTSSKYAVSGANCVITDSRLVNKTGYFIYATSRNVGFRDADLVYDEVGGTVTILNYHLPDGDRLDFFIPSSLTSDPALDALTTRVAKLEVLAAPFLVSGGGIVIWMKPVSQIPAGWEEVVELQGVFPLFAAASGPKATVGATGGSFSKLLTVDNIPEMDPSNGSFNRLLKWDGTGTAATVDNMDGPDGQQPNLLDSKAIKKVGTPIADQVAIDLTNPYRIAVAIKPIIV